MTKRAERLTIHIKVLVACETTKDEKLGLERRVLRERGKPNARSQMRVENEGWMKTHGVRQHENRLQAVCRRADRADSPGKKSQTRLLIHPADTASLHYSTQDSTVQALRLTRHSRADS